MKLKHFLPLAIIAILASCNSNPKLQEYHGKIEKIKVTGYSTVEKFGELVPEEIGLVYTAEFNKQNVPIVETFYDEDGYMIQMVKTAYDKNNNIVKYELYGWDEELAFSQECTYKGDKIQTMTTRTDISKPRKYQYKYKKGKIASVELYVDDELNSTNIHEYKKEQCEVNIYAASGELIETYYVKRNKYNQILSYQEDDKILSVEYNKENLPSKVENFKYDYNFIARDKIQERTGRRSCEIEYEYDKKGNWDKKIIYDSIDDSNIIMVLREITYR